MAFASEAHKRKLAELVTQGKVSQSDFNRMSKETGRRKLPERVKPKQAKAPKGGRR